MRKLLLFVFIACAMACIYAQDKNALAKSDSLYAKGVELYRLKKYKEAIPYFTESDSIDKAELDSTSNRRNYSAMWLASCYFHIGDSVTAGDIYPKYYHCEPVDRRLTLESDSLYQLGFYYFKNEQYSEAFDCLLQSAAIEKEVIGEEHYLYGETTCMISFLYTLLGKYDDAARYATESLKITEKNLDYVDYLSNLALIYSLSDNKAEAIRFGTEALELYNHLNNKYDLKYLSLLDDLIDYNKSLNNYTESIRLGVEKLKIQEIVSGKGCTDYARSLNNLAVCYSELDNYEEAVRLGTEALEIAEKVLGKEHPDYAMSLNNLALYHFKLGNYEEAVRLGAVALEIWEKTLGKEHPEYAMSLGNLAGYHSKLGNYAEAVRLGTEAMKIREKVLGEGHPDYAMSLNDLADYNANLGNYAEAVRLGAVALEIWEKTLGKEHPNCAVSLYNLADYNANLGNYAEAVRLGTEALEIREKVLGKEHPDYAVSLNNLALYHRALGNYAEAVRLGTEALEIREKVLGKEHPDYATSLNNLASYHCDLGNYADAVRLGTEALEIREKVLGKGHPSYAVSLNNLATHHYKLGNYAEAVRLGTEAMEIREKVLGKEHPSYAESLGNLANYHSALGNHAEAVRLGTEVLEIFGKVLGKEHPGYAISLNNLACYHFELGNYAEAVRLGTEVLEIREKALGTEHPDYATSLNNLASCHFKLVNYSEAVRLGTEALETQEKALGKEHPDYAKALNNLANYHSDLGNYAEAVRLGTEALEIQEKVLGKEHPDYIVALKTLIRFHIANNSIDCDSLDNWITEINQQESKYIRKQFSGLSSNERSMLWNQYKDWFEQNVNRYTFKFPTESNVSNAYDAALLSKGILLQSDIELSKLLLENGDDDLLDTYNELRMTRLMLNRLYEKPINERIVDTDSLERVATALERELVLRSKAFGDFTRNMAIGWKDVQKQLKKKDIAVEFVSFALENYDRICYAAYILTPDMQAPRMVPLFDSKQLAQIKSSDYYRTGELSSLIWGKLDGYLKGVDNIYFAPAGELYNIGIETLPDYDGDGMMYDRFKLYRLSSTRELAVVKDKNEIDDAVLYGGLQYDTDVKVLAEDAVRYPLSSKRDFSPFNLADSLDSSDMRNGTTYLPATKTEVENISRSLEPASINPRLYIGLDGTEGSFKDLSGRKTSLMHIATHGFYWTESEVRRSMNLPFLMDGNTPRYTEDKAMTRSGLLFAGANYALKGNPVPENANDGILTAKEIAALDLRGLDLVVLSACQTGLGEITGDGVFGLQRGFKKAGANTLLMSLWKVDDRATQMLMTRFYEYLLNGKSKYESLILAQKYVREYEEEVVTDGPEMTAHQKRRAKSQGEEIMDTPAEKVIIRPFADPRYWAAFILLDALN